LGSQRPGGHKEHLEAAEERRPLGRRERIKRGQRMAAEESCRDSIKKEKKRQLQE
jgi:hypothetical protein